MEKEEHEKIEEAIKMISKLGQQPGFSPDSLGLFPMCNLETGKLLQISGI